MILLVGFYQDVNAVRTEEFIECARRNIANSRIDQLTVFIEDSASAAEVRAHHPTLVHAKVRLLEHGRRLTFAHLFGHADRHLAGSAVIIANADIFFDETLALLDEEPLGGTMLCLSRWDEGADGTLRHFDRPDSQDAWIFEAPLPRIESDFCLGMPGCDNRLAHEAERAGLTVSNPSRSVRAQHLHRSAVRRYTQRDGVPGPHRPVPASFLNDSGVSPLCGRPAPADFPSHRGRRVGCIVEARYRELEAVLASHLDGLVPRALRRELRRAVANGTQGTPRPTGAPLAVVAFRESMGYTLARIELGVSTHSNDPRPLVSIPSALAGLCFTQVVANHASPVDIEFRSEGRLLVLASPGWEGYAPAVAFLDDAGWREPIDVLRTRDGTTFEAWSLVAGAGERLVVPTQVMLATDELIRMS